ncbi:MULTISPECIES: hypothetical protein [unclassified Microcoleus]|uniref:hypothetical protein n=1 Tax=unclassified Microcoleus TaxID=2642155 RepID=UPI0025CCCCEB|nr:MULTISPECIES: hypothetical protein [unclassified Microcoleus]
MTCHIRVWSLLKVAFLWEIGLGFVRSSSASNAYERSINFPAYSTDSTDTGDG